jgi:hypothetical protein
MKRILAVSVAATMVTFAGQALAGTLDGDNVTVNYLYPDIGTIYQTLGTGTVTSAGFTVNSFGQHNYTVYPSEITLTNVFSSDVYFLSASFNGYELIDNTGSPAITGVSVAFSDIAGFSSSDVSFDPTHVWLNLQNLTTTPGLDLELDLQFGSTQTPEAATLLLFGTAVLGIALLGWRTHNGADLVPRRDPV